MEKLQEKIKQAASFIREKGVGEIEIGLILGSGLGELGDEVENAIQIPYETIPNFPTSTVEGHAGQLVYGTLGGKKVLAMQGRFHYYEGYSLEMVTFPVRVMKALGIHSVIVTNAAGGLNLDFTPGELMLITDQINFTGVNPLIGPNDNEMGVRFTDMSQAYDKEYQEIVRNVAKEMNLDLKEGVYMGFTGPTYETPAEIKMARVIGADAVGMSTVPEVIVARHSGLRVIGVSCITNLAAGMQASLNHAEVVETTERVKESFKTLVKNILASI
ncbi:MAG: purine-nucleoside phosphorylase [Carnobacterium sp.]|jgi:purine-nucleoside phosphorylase|uniref:Purine nucleoside phosphorylase n=2 Tax=Carnobacterium maltaromaticum TaxID=2751 RepID=K8EUV0_CARML|nr:MULTISPECIES: purine-nucleoside phosphorylase [Carnobacterium]AOA02835.1 purine-nucleoside phosphorylase [Carnobacterium maltaromaticum]KRN66467.1 purine nucleoside phosphorylase [Carnobacterium maltaromaticum DSM 20342]KRN71961.1 purine nucleoside phosphorylase [Carnobacterium maltaromaticum]MBQ6485566.1 purine-nucleoside phosphorylase [Carnobacterium sp.]MCC4312937.1 purine nucleoside phosphorylase [Carnobacterium maltaromaticum]